MKVRSGSIVLALVAAGVVAAERPARADDAACIAASEAALAQKKLGKLRASLGPLAVCADPACPAEIKAECAKQIDAVKAALPAVTLIVKDHSGNDVTGVRVAMDGVPLPSAFDGTPLTLDPGEHDFRFEAPGYFPMERKLVMRVGERDRHETVVLASVPVQGYWTTQRTLGIVAMGVGVGGLVTGAVFTAFAASAKSREQSDCSAAGCISYPQGVEDYNTATKNATGATVGFVAGGVLAAAGVVIFVTARGPRAAPAASTATGYSLRLSPLAAGSGRGLSLGGSF